MAEHVLGHFLAAAELVDEGLVEPGLVDAERGIGEQAVAVEALDVVAFEGAAVAPDVDVVFLHGDDEHGAGDGASDGRGVEVVHAGGGDVEGAGLQGGDAFGHELLAAIDEARFFGAVLQGAARDLVVIGLVGLAEIGGVGIRNGALGAHPMDGGAGIEAAGESEADFFAGRQVLKNVSHVMVIGIGVRPRAGGPTFRIACKRARRGDVSWYILAASGSAKWNSRSD